jgi:hypothetical protein
LKRTPIRRKTPLRRKKKEYVLESADKAKKEVVVEKVFRDGRTKINLNCKAGRDLYESRKRFAWEQQGRLCSLCHGYLAWADSTVDHKGPRGMGGGSRDDRQENIAAAHGTCNALRGSRRSGFYDFA